MRPSKPGTAYVLKMYPRFSETFIVSEILAREATGERIEIFSLRPPGDARFHASLGRVQAPVTYIDRPSKTDETWDLLRNAATGDFGAALSCHLPDLIAADPDDAVQALGLALALRGRNLIHLHAHFGSVATTVARLTSALTGIPYSFTAHAADIFRQPDNTGLQTKLDQAHHSITISSYNLHYLRRHFPSVTTRLHLVRNGLELDRFPYQERPGQRSVVHVAAVGRLVEKKGFAYLIEAAAHLRNQGFPLEVTIAGSGPLAGELEARIARLGLTDCVRLLGAQTQDQIGNLLARADLFVAPCVIGSDGNADGIPTVLLEAMASGVPCIATSVTGIPEVIRHGRTGLLVPPGDPLALAHAITDLSLPDNRGPALARAARALIEQDYDSRKQARRLQAAQRTEAA